MVYEALNTTRKSVLATNPWGLCVRLNFCKVGKCRNLNHSFPLYFSFRFQAISIRTLKANVSDLTLPNKIAERLISLQCDIYMPMLFYNHHSCQIWFEHNVCHCSSVKRAVSTVCFSYLVGVFLNTPSKLFTFPWRLLRKIQEYQWLRFMCIYGDHWVSGLLTWFFGTTLKWTQNAPTL